MLLDPPAPATRPAQAALEAKLLAALDIDEPEAARWAAEWGETDHHLPRPPPPLARSAHAAYLRTGLRTLPPGFVSLSAGRPWIVYWVSHGLALLGEGLEGRDAQGGMRNGERRGWGHGWMERRGG